MASSTPLGDTIGRISKEISQQVREYEHNLSLVFAPHTPGRRDDALALLETSLRQHPAGVHIRPLLRNLNPSENSGFCGLSLHTRRLFFGLMRRTSALGLSTINIEEFSNTDEARHTMYHHAWHALALMAARRKPEYRGKFDDGPMIPKHKPALQSRMNLRADSFAAAMIAFQGRTGEAKILGAERARQSLAPIQGHNPSLYPYPLVTESAHFAIADISGTSPLKSRLIPLALQVASDVGSTIDERLLRQWHSFCVPAQDMAWRGYEPARILGAAIHASEDPYTRSIGYLVSELTGISPLSASEVKKGYNAFTDTDINARAHREAENEAFAEAAAQVAFENNSAPFLAAANVQNRSLAEGRIFGWCAAALQAAARAFDMARAGGRPAEQAARDKFNNAREEISWNALDALGKKIIEKRQQGHAITLGGLSHLCTGLPGLSGVSESLTLSQQDPEFTARLEIADALAFIPQPAPAANAPSWDKGVRPENRPHRQPFPNAIR